MPENTDNNRISCDIAIIETNELYTFFKNESKNDGIGPLQAKNSLCFESVLDRHFESVLKMKFPQGAFLKAFLKNLSP